MKGRRGRFELFEDAEGDEGFAGDLDFGEIEVAVVGELVELAGFGAEDTDEMLGIGTGELGDAAADLGDEEAAARHD